MARLAESSGKPKKPAPQRAGAAYDAKQATQQAENTYYTKVIANGKTQAQIDAETNAQNTATQIGGKVVGGQVVAPVVTTPASTSTTSSTTSSSSTSSAVNKTVSGTNTVTRNGRQIVITTFSDGTTSEVDYGLSAGDAANQQNWLQVGKSLLEQYGVGELWNDYSDLITKNGYDSQTAMLAMQSLPSWTNRFSANKDRLAKGLPVLDPATYLATEAQYKQVMIAAGIDKSVYSNNKYLGDLMGADVSPYETKQRLDAARVQLESTDTFVLDQLKTRFGLTTGDIILHMLDPKVASSVIASKVASAQVNAEAARQGFGLSVSEADQLESFGVTQDQARVGFSDIAQMGQLTEALPGNETGSVTKQELVGSTFKTDATAVSNLKKVKGRRVAEFEAGGEFAASQTGVSGLGTATRGT
jgi:hypothetical protein